MNTIDVINKRRSIRKFQDKPISKDILETLLTLATKAPSGKNRQPWRYCVLQNTSKNRLAQIMEQTVETRRLYGQDIGSCNISIQAITEAPVVILVLNPYSKKESTYNHHRLLADTQSIGASIQTLLLAAKSFDIGSLWICDVFYSQKDIESWLDTSDELIAAVALGYANQTPYPRPRKPLNEVVRWLD
jgi:nitroreductase